MDNIILMGNRIRSRREELNLTMVELASKIGVNDTTILRYERGEIKRPKLPVIQAIANALEVNPSWLVGKSEQKDIQNSSSHTELKDVYFSFAKEMQDKNISESDMKKLWAFYDMIQNK